MGHDDARAHLEHRQVAASERRARVGRRHQRAHLRDQRLGGRRRRFPVVRVERLVDRHDELGQGPQPREPEALRGDLEELGAGEPAAVSLEVDALGLEQPAVQVEQRRAQRGKIGGHDRIVPEAS